MNRNFYTDLPGFSNFADFTDLAHYHALPEDWLVATTDIVSSSQAIEKGKYQAVNVVSTATITAVINAIEPISAPYAFGGDGAAICVPAALRQDVASALMAARKLARESFDLDLRVGMTPMQDILNAGYQVLVGKYQPSAHFQQAVFQGGGLQYAETLLKANHGKNPYVLDENTIEAKANFEGFECRWNEIPGTQEEMVALIVRSTTQASDEANQIYTDVLENIFAIYGEEAEHHPLHEENLSLTYSPKRLLGETKVRTAFQGFGKKITYLIKTWAATLFGKYMMKNNIQTESTDWGGYKARLIKNTDHRKFDDTLRMVISGTKTQREQLDAYLQAEYLNGRLVYGIHHSENAIITCVVFNYDTEHIHFLDGANGGYALAAKAMKEQLETHR